MKFLSVLGRLLLGLAAISFLIIFYLLIFAGMNDETSQRVYMLGLFSFAAGMAGFAFYISGGWCE